MDYTKILPSFTDARGVISDILQDIEINSVTLITSLKGSTRGDHYHRYTTQWMYILSGKLWADTISGSSGHSFEICTGDLVCIHPGEWHTFRALEDTTFLVFTQGPRAGKEYDSDTVHFWEVWSQVFAKGEEEDAFPRISP